MKIYRCLSSGVATPRQLWAMPRLPFGLPRLPWHQIDKTFYGTLMLLVSCPCRLPFCYAWLRHCVSVHLLTYIDCAHSPAHVPTRSGNLCGVVSTNSRSVHVYTVIAVAYNFNEMRFISMKYGNLRRAVSMKYYAFHLSRSIIKQTIRAPCEVHRKQANMYHLVTYDPASMLLMLLLLLLPLLPLLTLPPAAVAALPSTAENNKGL